MWKLHIPMSLPFDWDGLCDYWETEFHKAIYLYEPFNQFVFDIFRKMLYHNGFANDNRPFYLGYVTAKLKTKVSAGNIFTISFHPSWKNLNDKARICYIG